MTFNIQDYFPEIEKLFNEIADEQGGFDEEDDDKPMCPQMALAYACFEMLHKFSGDNENDIHSWCQFLEGALNDVIIHNLEPATIQ